MPSRYKAALLERIRHRDAKVCVVGLGYVGLPLAIAISRAGYTAHGIDLSQSVVETINSGGSHISDVRADEVARAVASGKLVASTTFACAQDADVVVIAVPTPIDEYRVPDLSYVTAAAAELASNIRRGALVVLESTTYPGTTEEILAPAFRARGLAPGEDVFIAYSPERIDPGNASWNVSNTPKIVSGITAECVDAATSFYGTFVEQLVPVSNVRTAEIAKLFENIFRCVNIALVNEFEQICDGFGIDVWEVIQACSTKPYGYMPFYPGPGLGGHCVPVDPFYLAWKARQKSVSTEFIELAGRVNANMPKYIVSKVAAALNGQRKSLNGARVALLGVAYKKNSADVRESPAIKLLELLIERGATVSYHDPHVPALKSTLPMTSHPLTREYLASQDCVVVATDHERIDWSLVLGSAPLLLDTRNVVGRLGERGHSNGHLEAVGPAANGDSVHG